MTLLHAAVLAFIVSMLADAYTTYKGLASGRGKEKNPLSRWIFNATKRFPLWVRIVLGAVVKDVMLMGAVAYSLFRVSGVMIVCLYLFVVSAAQLYVAYRNYRLVRSWGAW